MPTQLLYGGGGFVLMVVLLVIFWPDSNNDPNVEPTEVAEIFVLETEDPATSTATATPTMTVTSTVILSATPSPSQTPSPTPTIAPSVPPPNAELGDIWVRPKDGMVMVFVPPPDEPFTLESGVDAPMEGYWIDKFEVSNAQYQLCVDAGICEPAAFINDDRFNGAEYPVVRVSAIDAEAYGYWVGGILPTKEEWEWAAFGDTGFRYPWGDEFDEMRVNICDLNCLLDGRLVSIDDGYRYTAPVDSFPEGANWVNALNMSGNVWEWTASELEYNGHMSRYLKGGAWNTPGIDYGTVAYTILRNYNVGFRLVVHNTNTLSP